MPVIDAHVHVLPNFHPMAPWQGLGRVGVEKEGHEESGTRICDLNNWLLVRLGGTPNGLRIHCS